MLVRRYIMAIVDKNGKHLLLIGLSQKIKLKSAEEVSEFAENINTVRGTFILWIKIKSCKTSHSFYDFFK